MQSSQFPEVPPKAGQVLGIGLDSPTSSIRKYAPKDDFLYNQSRTDRSMIVHSVAAIQQQSNRAASTGSSQSGCPPRVAITHPTSQGFGPRSRCTNDTRKGCATSATLDRRLPAPKERQLQQPRPSTIPSTLLSMEAKSPTDRVAKVKTKRSFRDFFHKRDKSATNSSKDNGGKRSSFTTTGSAIARRLRNSANFSKTTLPQEGEKQQAGVKPMAKIAAATAPDALPKTRVFSPDTSSSSDISAQATRENLSHIINTILSHVKSLPPDSADRLKGLEIAEVCQNPYNQSLALQELVLTVKKQAIVHAIEIVHKAKISAQKAKKHARDAELYFQTANLELQRLQRLVENDFDDVVIKEFKDMITSLGLSDLEGVVTTD